jgi:ABC-2 type transport system permease protein
MLQWRAGIFMTFGGNILYLVIIYNLWQSIYASSPNDTVNGMSFTDTMIYLVLAMTVFNLINLWVVWDMSRQIQKGDMILNLIRPMEYREYMFFSTMGSSVVNFFMLLIPTFIVVSVITGWAIPIGLNLVLFVPSLLFAFVVNYYINFLVGTICLYTESTWGIDTAKDVIILLLSGAVIPLAFFPDGLRRIVEFLPFQAIYNVPLQILTGRVSSIGGIFILLSTQLFWLILTHILSGLFWKKSIKVITINGG